LFSSNIQNGKDGQEISAEEHSISKLPVKKIDALLKAPLEKSLSMPDMQNKFKKRSRIVA
jgi:hypothetical protein